VSLGTHERPPDPMSRAFALFALTWDQRVLAELLPAFNANALGTSIMAYTGTLSLGMASYHRGERIVHPDWNFGRFENVRVPLDGLLDKYASVSADGTYSSPIPTVGARFGTMVCPHIPALPLIARGGGEDGGGGGF